MDTDYQVFWQFEKLFSLQSDFEARFLQMPLNEIGEMENLSKSGPTLIDFLPQRQCLSVFQNIENDGCFDVLNGFVGQQNVVYKTGQAFEIIGHNF